MMVYCVFSLESPHRGDSNEYTQYTIFMINKKITLNYSKSAATGFSSKGLKRQFETAMVNEPSVFEPLKFYCIWFSFWWHGHRLVHCVHWIFLNLHGHITETSLNADYIYMTLIPFSSS